MKLVYISGPYSAPTINGVHDNIERARAAAVDLWQKGYAVICPHLNSAYMDGVASWETFMEADLLILSKCDAIYMLPGWEKSTGARMELAKAKELGLDVLVGHYSL